MNHSASAPSIPPAGRVQGGMGSKPPSFGLPAFMSLQRLSSGFALDGFTLAELLIALVILGVIATFTIPKVLIAQQDGRFKAIGKETAGMISGAYDAYRLQNTAPSNMLPSALTPYMNYVAYDTTSRIDNNPTLGYVDCSNSNPCLRLHNGGILFFWNDGGDFGGTNPSNFVNIAIDPDGKYSGSTNGPGKTLSFVLYYNGRLTTYGQLAPGSNNSLGPHTADPAMDPDWFSWD